MRDCRGFKAGEASDCPESQVHFYLGGKVKPLRLFRKKDGVGDELERDSHWVRRVMKKTLE